MLFSGDVNKIKFYRKQRNLSQRNLAKLMYVSQQTISKWETGEAQPQADRLIELSSILNVSVNELITDNNESLWKAKNITSELKIQKLKEAYRKYKNTKDKGISVTNPKSLLKFYYEKLVPKGFFIIIDITRDVLMEIEKIKAIPVESCYRNEALYFLRRLLKDYDYTVRFQVELTEKEYQTYMTIKEINPQYSTETYYKTVICKRENGPCFHALLNAYYATIFLQTEILNGNIYRVARQLQHWGIPKFGEQRYFRFINNQTEDKKIVSFLRLVTSNFNVETPSFPK